MTRGPSLRVVFTLFIGLVYTSVASIALLVVMARSHDLTMYQAFDRWPLLFIFGCVLPGAYLTTAAIAGAEAWDRDARRRKGCR